MDLEATSAGVPDGDDSTRIEHVDEIAAVEHQRHVVLDDQHGSAEGVAQITQPVSQPLRGSR